MNATSMTGISSFSQTNTARRINHLKPTQSKDDSIFKVPKFIRPGGLKVYNPNMQIIYIIYFIYLFLFYRKRVKLLMNGV